MDYLSALAAAAIGGGLTYAAGRYIGGGSGEEFVPSGYGMKPWPGGKRRGGYTSDTTFRSSAKGSRTSGANSDDERFIRSRRQMNRVLPPQPLDIPLRMVSKLPKIDETQFNSFVSFDPDEDSDKSLISLLDRTIKTKRASKPPTQAPSFKYLPTRLVKKMSRKKHPTMKFNPNKKRSEPIIPKYFFADHATEEAMPPPPPKYVPVMMMAPDTDASQPHQLNWVPSGPLNTSSSTASSSLNSTKLSGWDMLPSPPSDTIKSTTDPPSIQSWNPGGTLLYTHSKASKANTPSPQVPFDYVNAYASSMAADDMPTNTSQLLVVPSPRQPQLPDNPTHAGMSGSRIIRTPTLQRDPEPPSYTPWQFGSAPLNIDAVNTSTPLQRTMSKPAATAAALGLVLAKPQKQKRLTRTQDYDDSAYRIMSSKVSNREEEPSYPIFTHVPKSLRSGDPRVEFFTPTSAPLPPPPKKSLFTLTNPNAGNSIYLTVKPDSDGGGRVQPEVHDPGKLRTPVTEEMMLVGQPIAVPQRKIPFGYDFYGTEKKAQDKYDKLAGRSPDEIIASLPPFLVAARERSEKLKAEIKNMQSEPPLPFDFEFYPKQPRGKQPKGKGKPPTNPENEY